MRPLKPLGTTEGFGCGLFLVGFGMIFILMGLAWGTSQAGALLRSVDWGLILGSFLFIAFGIMVTWGGLAQAHLFSQFSRPLAEVSDDIRPGETFRFFYTQPLRRSMDIQKIGIYLVFREGVTYQLIKGGDTESSNFDRLIQASSEAGRSYAAGERLTVEHVFQLPRRAMGIRNPYMNRLKAAVQPFWIVKIRLTQRKGLDVWREYALPVEEKGEALIRHVQTKMPEGQFELLLQYNSGKDLLRMARILEPVLPHLRGGQISDLYLMQPCLLRENLTEGEAESLKERLVKFGVTVITQPTQQETPQ